MHTEHAVFAVGKWGALMVHTKWLLLMASSLVTAESTLVLINPTELNIKPKRGPA